MLKWFRNDKRGVLFVYMVLIISIIALVFFWFFFATVIESIQESLNPQLVESAWMTTGHYNAFVYASTFVTYLWQFLVAIGLFVLAYWVYIYNQRREAGY